MPDAEFRVSWEMPPPTVVAYEYEEPSVLQSRRGALMSERIQLRRTLGWRKPEGAIVVARPSRFGNPFKVGMVIDRISLVRHGVRTVAEVRIETRRQAVDIHRRWLDGTPFLVGGHDLAPLPPTIAEIKTALRGHDLACWCPLNQPWCHGNTLLERANA